MSLKSRFLQYVVDTLLVGLNLMPITAQNHIYFTGNPHYTRKLMKSSQAFTDIVVKKDAIEKHEYMVNPQEAYSYTRYDSTQDFLRAIIKQRIEWHLTYQVKSTAVEKLHGRSDAGTLKAANAQLYADRRRIREANFMRLEQKLKGVYVKIVKVVFGF